MPTSNCFKTPIVGTSNASNRNAAYGYNGTGARVQKTVNGIVTLFAYDEAGHLTGDYTATGSASIETVYLGDMPVAGLKGSAKYYVHADYRNAPRQIDDANRAAVWTWNPLPFGENVAVTNPLSYNLRFPGQYFDSESGLFQNGYRDYDPAAGQYLESDLIGLGGGINTYGYGFQNPLSFTDPSGLFGVADLPSIPDPVFDFALGVADDLSFGIGPLLRSEYDISGPDRCSTAYKAGEYASLAVGLGRIGYAGTVKTVSLLPSLTGAEASAFRNAAKRFFRGPLAGSSYRMYTYEEMLAQKGSDAAVKAAAGRTSPLINSFGADAGLGGAANSASACGCQK